MREIRNERRLPRSLGCLFFLLLAHPAAAEGDLPAAPGYVAQTFSHQAMSTEFQFTLYVRVGDLAEDELPRIANEAFEAVDDLEARLSNWRPTSQISYVNARAAKEPVKAAADIIELTSFAKDFWADTEHTFDVSVGPLIKLYGFYRKQGKLPSNAELTQTLSLVGMDKVTVDKAAGTIAFAKDGMLLDFGGIGKGLALDEAANVLKKCGVAIALLNGGTSSIVALGAPPDEPGWTIKIRHPYRDGDTIDQVIIANESLSTSGCYGSQLEAEGKTLCHIFDPRTGTPVTGMLTAVAIAKTGTRTDALTKPFMVLGPEWTRQYCKEHPEIRAIVVPVSADGEPKPEHINMR